MKLKSRFSVLLSLFLLSGCVSHLPRPDIPSTTPKATSDSHLPVSSQEIVLTQEQLKEKIQAMTVEQKVGQLVLVSLDSAYLDETTEKWLTDYQVGNVILFGKNVDTTEQLALFTMQLQDRIQATTNIPALIGIDQEGATVSRIREGVTIFPSNMALGATKETDLYNLGWAMGEELRNLGINMNFAPVLDVNSNPDNPVINLRSYSDDPQQVAQLGSSYLKGMQDAKIVSVVKHFPGHGDTSIDSHVDLPQVNKTWAQLEKMELIPFKKAIETGVSAIMTSHILFPKIEYEKLPATLSTTIIQNLRDKLNFSGLIVSDSLQMAAIQDHYGMSQGAIQALQAGVDLLILGDGKINNETGMTIQTQVIQNLIQAVQQQEISQERLDHAVYQVLKTKNEIRLFSNRQDNHAPYADSLASHQLLVQDLTDQSMTLVRDDQSLLPLPEGNSLYLSSPSVYSLDFDRKSFGEVAVDRLGGKAINIHQDPTTSEIQIIVEKAKNYTSVVYLVHDMDQHPNQKVLLKQLLELDIPLAIICAGSPYDIQYLDKVKTVICTYGYTPATVQSMIHVLNGTLTCEGKLPFTLK